MVWNEVDFFGFRDSVRLVDSFTAFFYVGKFWNFLGLMPNMSATVSKNKF